MPNKRKKNNLASDSSQINYQQEQEANLAQVNFTTSDQQPKYETSKYLDNDEDTRKWERSEYFDNDKYDEWYHDADPDDENYYYLFDF
jgi:hypothetical protein